MRKTVRKRVEPLHQYFCDATGEQIKWVDIEGLDTYSIIGCEIQFNANYGGIVDGIPEFSDKFHLSQEVTKEFLDWLDEKYPESPLIKLFKEHEVI